MNYIKHLTGFFNRIAIENSLNPTHISLYLTLFQCWNINRFKNPITISRDEMMKGSKIASKATYHKCIKELQRLGFLDYQPSYNPYSGTLVFVHNLSEGYKEKMSTEPAKPKNEQVNSKAAEQVDGLPHIYNNKQTVKNNKNIDIEPEFLIFNNNSFLENQAENEKEKSSAKKEKFAAPSLELIKEYFKFQESSEFEAERFFNYYSSNGWLIGGKTKMKDWKASARNWMLNTSKFTINIPQANPAKEQPRAYNLHTVTDKNYAEPL